MNPWATWLTTYGTARYQLSRKQGWHAFVTAPALQPFEILSRPAMSRLSEEELEDGPQNSSAGSAIRWFHSRNRVLPNDAYVVLTYPGSPPTPGGP